MSQHWILAIVHEGFLRHLSVWEDDLRAKAECLRLLAPKFGLTSGGDVEKDWVALEEAHENAEDDGEYEFYLELLPQFPLRVHRHFIIDNVQ